MKDIKLVPMPIYEMEMSSKNNIIKILLGLIFTLIIILGIAIYLFVTFINSYDFTSYYQDGEGINNVNSGTQGDILNESNIETND